MDIPNRRPDLPLKEIEGETVILDRVNNKIHKLNEAASFVWSRIDGKATLDQLAEALTQEYAVDSVTAKKDLKVIIDEFSKQNLLN